MLFSSLVYSRPTKTSTKDTIFFKSGHVQQIQIVSTEKYSYVRASVLPSMKKGTGSYKTKVCLLPTGMVEEGVCACSAGLGGCCNHVAALLYALEEFVRFGLREEDHTSPTSRLCAGNRPRARKVKPREVADGNLVKPTFGSKGSSLRRSDYNPVPPNKRILEPEHMERFAVTCRLPMIMLLLQTSLALFYDMDAPPA